MSINDLSHEEISAWLARALHNREQLPRLTPDESPFLAILRLEKTLKPATRDSLRDGCLKLVRQFCADGQGDTAYVEQLLSLASAFKNPESVQLLAQLAHRFPQLPQTSVEVRLAVLAALVDTPPPQPPAFWDSVLKQDPEKYAGLALSGLLATHPAQAIKMLPAMPDTERAGQAATLKLDLAWDDLPPKKRFQFVQEVQAVLPQCGLRFVGPVKTWTDSKGEWGSTRRAVRLPDIERAMCNTFGLEPDALHSGRRMKNVSHPRMLAMWLARKHTRAALSEIGHYFGRSSHSTVISAEKKITRLMTDNAPFALAHGTCPIEDAIRRVEAQLRTG